MVQKAQRGRVEPDEKPDERAWEVFIRDNPEDALERAGRVLADSPDEAHSEASKLFAWYADELWVCPAPAIVKYSTAAADTSPEQESNESRTHEL